MHGGQHHVILTTSAPGLTFAHTVGSGSDGVLIVNVSFQAGSTSVLSVTYGGRHLTLIGSAENSSGANTRTEMWLLKERLRRDGTSCRSR